MQGDATAGRPGRRRRVLVIATVGAAVCAALAGCSTFWREAAQYQAGWRTARVLEVADAGQLSGTGYSDCRRQLDPEALAESRFARITYRTSQRSFTHVMLVANSTAIHQGDVVFTNISRCDSWVEVREHRHS